jgi:SAM-dependent methyltransferase
MRSSSDHFSTQASDYAKYRPSYPPELFGWLPSLSSQHDLVWDVGTGSGQAAVALAEHFRQVVATDLSTEQIANAKRHERVTYCVQPAEKSALANATVDLVTIAQALHWFDFDRFYAEVRRVLRPGGAIVAWTYALNEVTPHIDTIVRRFYVEVVGPYWPPERAHIEAGYLSLPFPFEELATPSIAMQTQWAAADYVGYLRTWSATQRYFKAVGVDPVPLIAEELASAWGDTVRPVTWPLRIRAGRR